MAIAPRLQRFLTDRAVKYDVLAHKPPCRPWGALMRAISRKIAWLKASYSAMAEVT